MSSTVALFPGSFKPPHARHLEAVQYLLARPDVDEVVIVISCRGRPLPGTDLVLNADLSVAVWRILLGATPRVRLTVARHSAVEHVRELINASSRDQRLLLCLGEEDFARGDRRFDELLVAAQARGNSAEIIAIPASRHSVRATQIRACLAAGAAGRSEFTALFRDAASPEVAERIWVACTTHARPLTAHVAAILRGVVADHGYEIDELELVTGAADRTAFLATTATGRQLLLKYAGDEVGADEDRERPRYRLATERRALQHLRRHLAEPESVSEVAFYHEKTRVLGVWLPSPRPSPVVVADAPGSQQLLVAVAAWLADLHAVPAPAAPLRGSAERELHWWRSRLNTVAQTSLGPPQPRPGVFHLAFRRDLLHLRGLRAFVTDFEASSSFGDPAFDLGCLAASFVADATVAHEARGTIATAFDTYAQAAGHCDPDLLARAWSFAAAKLTTVGGERRAWLHGLGNAWLAERLQPRPWAG